MLRVVGGGADLRLASSVQGLRRETRFALAPGEEVVFVLARRAPPTTPEAEKRRAGCRLRRPLRRDRLRRRLYSIKNGG